MRGSDGATGGAGSPGGPTLGSELFPTAAAASCGAPALGAVSLVDLVSKLGSLARLSVVISRPGGVVPRAGRIRGRVRARSDSRGLVGNGRRRHPGNREHRKCAAEDRDNAGGHGARMHCPQRAHKRADNGRQIERTKSSTPSLEIDPHTPCPRQVHPQAARLERPYPHWPKIQQTNGGRHVSASFATPSRYRRMRTRRTAGWFRLHPGRRCRPAMRFCTQPRCARGDGAP